MKNPHDIEHTPITGTAFDNIPAKMKQYPHWILWKLEDKGREKPSKTPYSVRGGLAKVNDPDTWWDYDKAVSAFQRGNYSGIGFVFTDTPFVAVDIDGCFDPATGEISSEAQDAVSLLASYTELSQSGTGFHIITEGKLPDGRRRKGAFEMYGEGSARYFAMTGNVYGSHREIRACQSEIDEVHRKYIEPPDNEPPPPAGRPELMEEALNDQQVIARARLAKNGVKFARLWEGDTSDYDNDHSRADLALCSILAFWCQREHGRIDSLFRQSGLMRSKWDEMRGRDTYGNKVIEKAIKGCREVFQGQTGEEEWTPPIPFETIQTPDFPTECLPGPIADFVAALAENTQTPPEMGAILSLGVLAAAFQSRYEVEVTPDWREPLCLYTVAVAPPGERKSSVIAALTAPVHSYEAMRRDEEKSDIEQNRTERSLLEKAMQHAQTSAAKKKATEFEDEKQEALRLAEELAEFEDMHPYRLLVDDTTPEKLIEMMDQQNGCIAVASAEGGVFDSMSGRYDKGGNFDVYLKSHAGDPITVDRIGRSSNHVKHPRLSMLLTIQPEVLNGLMNNSTFRGRGLCGRFLYAIGKSKVGSRNVNPDVIPPRIKDDYHEFVKRILSEHDKGVIQLSEEADNLRIEYAASVERKLGDEWEHMRDWSGKLVGAMLRIAALIHAAEVQEFPADTPISPEILAAAARIADCLSVHAEAAYQVMGADDSYENAKYLLRRIDSMGKDTMLKNELWQKCKGKFKKARDMEPATQTLVEMGYIREETKDTGGRPSVILQVNPLYRKD